MKYATTSGDSRSVAEIFVGVFCGPRRRTTPITLPFFFMVAPIQSFAVAPVFPRSAVKAFQCLAVIESGAADLVAFGRPVIANPDFAERVALGAELAAPDFATFYTPGEKGYTDYPVLVG